MKKKKNPGKNIRHFILALCCALPFRASGQITTVQYWFDDDFAGRSPVAGTVAGNPSVQVDELNADVLPAGIHQLHIRAKDNNRWSVVHSQVFYKLPVDAEANGMAGYEYWLDSDFASRRSGTFVGGASGIIPDFNLSDSPEGIHLLHIRAKDSRGNYTPVHSQVFYKLPVAAEANGMAGYEYWLDNDFVHRRSGTFAGGASGIISDFDRDDYPEGIHVIYFRSKDSRGYWSGVHAQPFYVNVSEGETKISAYRYWYDNGFENNSLFPLTPTVASYELKEKLTLPAGFSEGEEHAFHIQFQNTAGQWSVASTDSFKIVPLLTGIADAPEFAGMYLYPNPVREELRMMNYELRQGEIIRILDLSGRVVMTAQGNIVRVSSLPAGVYFVKAGNQTAKFIKQ
jgi:hypothetical protein